MPTVKEDVRDALEILNEIDNEFILFKKGGKFQDELTDVHAQVRRVMNILRTAGGKMLAGQISHLAASETTEDGLGGIISDLNDEKKHSE